MRSVHSGNAPTHLGLSRPADPLGQPDACDVLAHAGSSPTSCAPTPEPYVAPFEDDRPHDHCGVFGVWAPGEDVARLTYFGLYALQHRGQQSAGIATSDGSSLLVYKDQGLVNQVFNEQTLTGLKGHIALGHVRYATTGADTWRNAQPALGPTPNGSVALAHNGNLINTDVLTRILRSVASDQDYQRGATTDTSLMVAMLGMADKIPGPTPFIPQAKGHTAAERTADTPDADISSSAPLVPAALKVLPQIRGAFSLAFMDETTLYGARDPHGFRPLVLGRLETGWVLASETAALDLVGARFVREIEPGELVAINSDGVRSWHFAPTQANTCVFEYVYLARPDTVVGGRQIVAARRQMGAILARECPVEADLVMPTPDSGTPAAIGYAEASGIPFAHGLVKNAYVGRTFIQPTQSLRQLGIRLKLNPLREVIEGKRLIVIDDSIVRGNTQRALVKMLREAGAAEVHVRISSPPVEWPCFFGIDFPTRAELVASSMSLDEICQLIGADSLGYLSLEGMVEATKQGTRLCLGCFTGDYPEPVAPGTRIPGTPGATLGC